jgi:hypothetical protein
MTLDGYLGTSFDAFHKAMSALHAFAKADNAPLGVDVIDYFKRRRDDCDNAIQGVVIEQPIERL